MKYRIITSIALLFFLSIAAKADTLNVSATNCDSCFFSPVRVDLRAQFTVEETTGDFYSSWFSDFIHGTFEKVTGISGTLNGFPMTLLPPINGGEGSWLFTPDNIPGTVYFMSNGSLCWLQYDGAYNLLEITDANGDGYGTNTPIFWSATSVSTPEPSVLLLLSPLALLALKRKRHD